MLNRPQKVNVKLRHDGYNGPHRGLFRDCKTSRNLRQPSLQALIPITLPFALILRLQVEPDCDPRRHQVWHLPDPPAQPVPGAVEGLLRPRDRGRGLDGLPGH